ncbi:MAG: hypothetical protein AB7M12_14135 [Hyphomonadaceae bacterium]
MSGVDWPDELVVWLLTSLLAAAIASVIGLFRFIAGQRQANRRPYLERQMDAIFDLSNAVATIATNPDPVEWEAARRTFWRYYWGPACIVEDRSIESVLEQLGRFVPKQPAPSDQIPLYQLEDYSYVLAHAARRLILANWKIQSEDLTLTMQEGETADMGRRVGVPGPPTSEDLRKLEAILVGANDRRRRA